MSEYWKSTPKYWCKHCSTYVKDTPFERKQHESTGKHQGNLKRFLRGIQNDHEKGEREKERAKAEVDRLNKVVGTSTSSTQAAGSSNAKPSTIRKGATGTPTAADQKRQWAQLAEMGIQVPEDFRAEMAMPGQWQTTSTRTDVSDLPDDSLSVGVRKRKVEGEEEEEAGETVKRRGWGTTVKRYPGDDDPDPDLDALLSGPIVKKKIPPKSENALQRENSVTVKAEAGLLAKVEDDNSKQSGSEAEDKAIFPLETGQAVDQVDGKEENVGLDGRTALTDTTQDVTAPLFKKRKVKQRTER